MYHLYFFFKSNYRILLSVEIFTFNVILLPGQRNGYISSVKIETKISSSSFSVGPKTHVPFWVLGRLKGNVRGGWVWMSVFQMAR